MLIFGIEFLCWFSMSRFFRINFSSVFWLLNYNFALVDITPFFFLPFSRFRYLFSNNFLLNIISHLFFSIFIAYVFLFLSIFYSFFAKSYIFYYDNVGPPYPSPTNIPIILLLNRCANEREVMCLPDTTTASVTSVLPQKTVLHGIGKLL